MVRAILEALPTWVILIIAIVVTTTFGLGGLRLFQRRFPHLTLRGDALRGLDTFFAACALLFGLSLSLVVVNGYDQMKRTDAVVREEATSVAQLYRDTRGLSGIAVGLERAVDSYVHGVVEDEWDRMGTGGESPVVDRVLGEMFDTMLAYRPANEGEQVAFREAFHILNELVAARRARLSAASTRVPAPLEVFLVVGGFLMIALAWLLCPPGDRRHQMMVVGFSAMIAFSVVLALVLAYPFAGDVRVEPEAFRLAILARFWS
ncbi:MAG: hypothetical protein RL383_1241 [Actinomycetota bacterium]